MRVVARVLRFVRNCVAGFAAAAVLLANLPVTAQQMVSVVGNKINMRAGPGTDHEVRWILGSGYPLMIVDRKDAWLKVQDFENDVGWILQSLTSGIAYHIVKARVANLRAKPSEQSRILGQALYGETLKTLEKRTDWVRVQRQQRGKGLDCPSPSMGVVATSGAPRRYGAPLPSRRGRGVRWASVAALPRCTNTHELKIFEHPYRVDVRRHVLAVPTEAR